MRCDILRNKSKLQSACHVYCKVKLQSWFNDSRFWKESFKGQQNVELNWIERQLSNRFPVNLCRALAQLVLPPFDTGRFNMHGTTCTGKQYKQLSKSLWNKHYICKNGSHRSSRDGSYRGSRFPVNLCRLLVHWWFSYCLVLVESSISFMVSLVPWSNHTVVKFPVNRASYMKNTVNP